MEYDFQKDVAIDPDALDTCWLDQPRLGLKYAELSARLKKVAALAEERVKVTRSELIHQCNQNPEACTGKKSPNAQDIEAYYRKHPDHKQAKEDLINAQYEADYAQTAHMEISLSRKTALENLVRLYTAQYFAGPKAPHDLSRDWEAKQRGQQSNNAVSQAMTRSRNS